MKKSFLHNSLTLSILGASIVLISETKVYAITASFNFSGPVANNSAFPFSDNDGKGFDLLVANAVSTDSPTAGALNISGDGLCAFYSNNAVASPFRCSSQVANGGSVNSTLTGFTLEFNRDVFLKSFDVSLFDNLTSGNISFSGGSNSPQQFNLTGLSTQNFSSPFVAIAGSQISVVTDGVISNNSSSGIFRINNLVVEEVPGPLPIFGALAGLGWSRKIKRKLSKFPTQR